MRKTTIAVLTAMMMVMTAVPAFAHGPKDSDRETNNGIAQLYRSTAKYRQVQNVLDDPSFGPFALDGTDVPTCFDDPDKGGMGIHYVRNVGDGEIDALNPEAMVYEVTKGGRLRLVAVEYVAVQALFPDGPPTLFGQEFTEKTFTFADGSTLAIYKLHVWIWKWNPSGLFADFNPRVSDCPST
jgi:hypothetical protein